MKDADGKQVGNPYNVISLVNQVLKYSTGNEK